MIVRKGEGQGNWVRANRYFKVGTDYFFGTREGTIVGPFDSVFAAEQGFSLYLQYLKEGKAAGIYASTIANKNPWDKAHYR